MKKFAKDNTFETQKFPPEMIERLMGEGFVIPEDSNRFICLFSKYLEDGRGYQVFIQDVNIHENNSYIVLFIANGEVSGHSIFPSHVIFPQVWQRTFGGMEYLDFIKIQEYTNVLMKHNFGAEIPIDYSKEGKSFYTTLEGYEKCKELIEKGEHYQILSVFADKAQQAWIDQVVNLVSDKVEAAKKYYAQKTTQPSL